jgi:hypothetical protein
MRHCNHVLNCVHPRLMLEYARLMSFDREAATYKDIDGDNNAW